MGETMLSRSIRHAVIHVATAAIVVLGYVASPRWLVAEEAANVKSADGPLKAYVAKEDKSYHWTKRREGKLGKGTFVELTLTSKTWKNIVWKHQLFIYRPSKFKNAAQGLLLIGDISWRPELEQPVSADAPLDFTERGVQNVEKVADLAEHMQ